jgi:hypothetical protein
MEKSRSGESTVGDRNCKGSDLVRPSNGCPRSHDRPHNRDYSVSRVSMMPSRARGIIVMPVTELRVDETPHNSDGLLLHGQDGPATVTAFISRRVLDRWLDPVELYGRGKSLQYSALGKLNLAAIERIIAVKYQREAAPLGGRRQDTDGIIVQVCLIGSRLFCLRVEPTFDIDKITKIHQAVVVL